MNPPTPNQVALDAPKLPTHPWSFVVYFLSSFKWPLVTILFLEAGQKACEILVPYAFKEILDNAMAHKGTMTLYESLKPNIWLFILVSFGTLIFARAAGALLVIVAPELRKLSRSKVYHYLQHHSQQYFVSQFAGSLANRINELSTSVNHGLWTVMFDFWPVIISFSTSLYLLYSAHYLLAVYLATWIVAYVIISFFLATKCRKYAQNFAASRSKTNGQIVDAVTNILNTKMFAQLKFERSRLSHQLENEIKTAKSTLWFMERMKWFQFTAALILQVGLILYALKLFSKNELSVGNFAMVASLGLLIINDARSLSRRFLEFFEYLGNISDGVKIIVKPHDIVDQNHAKPLKVDKGLIEFKNVNFAYYDGSKIFDQLNLKISAGDKVGLVGFSGSGKSSFVNLILRMYDIQSGEISIDGQNTSQCTQESLHEQISMIPQESMLFHRNLLENIRYGKPDASLDEVINAAKKAHAHEFICELKNGYETLVGERGIKLSGGQKQRVAITRAFLKNAPILILDEATSSLDSVTEKGIQDSLSELMKNRTVIVVAHRLSTLSQLNRILVFNKGNIIEDGTHDELIHKNGHYALLWKMQAGGFLPKSMNL